MFKCYFVRLTSMSFHCRRDISFLPKTPQWLQNNFEVAYKFSYLYNFTNCFQSFLKILIYRNILRYERGTKNRHFFRKDVAPLITLNPISIKQIPVSFNFRCFVVSFRRISKNNCLPFSSRKSFHRIIILSKFVIY